MTKAVVRELPRTTRVRELPRTTVIVSLNLGRKPHEPPRYASMLVGDED